LPRPICSDRWSTVPISWCTQPPNTSMVIQMLSAAQSWSPTMGWLIGHGIFKTQWGAIAGPFDNFLALRGLKTLALRMQRHCENAHEIAQWLETHRNVDHVLYPGLNSHPQHELAVRQMPGFGGMITFFIKGGLGAARQFLERCRLFALAESLGGVESLIEHPGIMTHASVPPETRAALGISDALIRLSVGVEDVADLIRDLSHAFID
jgi:cystathionine beta-lyase/cystathionine gamma-synthase